MDQTLGKRICASRKRLGLTQEQLAEKLGVTAQAVSKWENDQSCPDISILPRLAQVFGVSTDVLLGCTEPEHAVQQAQVVEENEPDGIHIETEDGSWNFSLETSRRGALWFAVLVIAVGVLYLLAQIFQWDVTFWQLCWPTALLVFGLSGLSHKFDFVNLASALLGAFFLADKLLPINLEFDSKVIIAGIVVLFGISLLVDGIRKRNKPNHHFHYSKSGNHKKTQRYKLGETSFEYDASFCEHRQLITLPLLRTGSVSTNFGEYSIDLSGVEAVAEDCCIDMNCSFGELTLWVPSRFRVIPDNSSAFGACRVDEHPGGEVTGIINLVGSVSFGEINVRYI